MSTQKKVVPIASLNDKRSCTMVHDLYWRKIDQPVGVEYNETHYIPSVPYGMGNNEVNYTTPYQWTNVRGYGNILQYQKLQQPYMVGYRVFPWNR